MLLKIDTVKMGKRIRVEYGEMQELADSIMEHGLLHPIVVDSQYNLIAGGRRLLACSRIGMKEIEVKVLGDLTAHELRVLELEENIKRKDLTELEKSKTLFELANLKRKELEEKERQEIERLEREDQERHAQEKDKPDNNETDKDDPPPEIPTEVFVGVRQKGGRPEKGVTVEKIAQELNIPRTTLIYAQKHVEAVTQFPELETLPKYAAIEQAKQNNDPRVLDLAQQRKRREEEAPQPEEPGTPGYNEYIDFCAKVAKNFNKVIYSAAMLETNDQHLNALKELIDRPDMIQEYIAMISEAVPRLLKVQKFLREMKV